MARVSQSLYPFVVPLLCECWSILLDVITVAWKQLVSASTSGEDTMSSELSVVSVLKDFIKLSLDMLVCPSGALSDVCKYLFQSNGLITILSVIQQLLASKMLTTEMKRPCLLILGTTCRFIFSTSLSPQQLQPWKKFFGQETMTILMSEVIEQHDLKPVPLLSLIFEVSPKEFATVLGQSYGVPPMDLQQLFSQHQKAASKKAAKSILKQFLKTQFDIKEGSQVFKKNSNILEVPASFFASKIRDEEDDEEGITFEVMAQLFQSL